MWDEAVRSKSESGSGRLTCVGEQGGSRFDYRLPQSFDFGRMVPKWKRSLRNRVTWIGRPEVIVVGQSAPCELLECPSQRSFKLPEPPPRPARQSFARLSRSRLTSPSDNLKGKSMDWIRRIFPIS